MSDFDDFFAKRLDEEASFPNRSKNWKQMSKRLDAFEVGAGQGHRPWLRWWQAAAIVGIATAGFLLWKNLQTQQENQALRQQIAAWQNRPWQSSPNVAEIQKQPEAIPEQTIQRNETLGLPPESTSTVSTKNAQPNLFLPPSRPAALPSNRTEDATLPSQAMKPSPLSTGLAEKAPTLLPPHTLAPATATDSLRTTDAAILAEPLDSLKKGVDKDSLLAQSDGLPIDSNSTLPSTPVKEIKPFQTEKARFRIGVQAIAGFVQPRQNGVSTLRGQGITAELRLFRNVWLNASVDWLQNEVNTNELVAKFHPRHDSFPKPPGHGGGGPGGPPPPKLVQVESNPRQQHFSLGLRYELPIEFWVRPSVRVAHTWVRVSPTLVTYKFLDNDPGGPGPQPPPRHEYTAEKFDAQWVDNQWRIGLSLEKETRDWTFGISADYSKNFAVVTPSFDAIYLKAGAQYRF